MKIGITYDLRDTYIAMGLGEEAVAEFDRRDTIDAIKGALEGMGYQTDPIGNLYELIPRLTRGDRWDLVFNIAEGLRGFGREAQVPALLDAYGIPYTFSDPMVLSLTLHKGMTKRVIRDLGIPTPDFVIVETEEDADGVDLPFPLFAKPVAEGTGKGISGRSKVACKSDLKVICAMLLKTFTQPVLVERFMPGREFTVGIVGTGDDASAVGVMEVILKDSAESSGYSYLNKKLYEDRVEYRLANGVAGEKAKAVAVAAWRGLGCRDGGRIDIRADEDGMLQFLEVNPLAGLHPDISDLPILAGLNGLSYPDLIGAIMNSALRRIPSP